MRRNLGPAEGIENPVYQVRLPLSTRTLTTVADLLRAHLKRINSRWRKLPAGRIAVITLAVLRHDQRLLDMAGGNGVSPSTVRRWVLEVIQLLARRAERLDRVLRKIARTGGHVVLIDGTLIRTRRRTGKDNRRNYSGKHKCHGLLFLALTDHKGRLLWLSAARPGRSSEITARYNKLVEQLRAHELGAIGDLGFTGLDDDPDNPVVITGYKAARTKAPDTREEACQQADRVRPRGLPRARLRAPEELAHPHQAPPVRHATTLLRALLVLTNIEVAR